MFIGGGIFYGLKIWQGSALGCPEPIIQEIKTHDHEHILPYHGHFSSSDSISSYPGPSPDILGGHSSYGGYYSNTPGYSSYPPSGGGGPGASFSGPPSAMADTLAPTSYPSRRQSNGRQLSESSAQLFGDLFFRFLGVETEVCKKRFICEMQFRNPFLGYAFRYIG